MAKNEIGRNDPCPCGSGNKYKKWGRSSIVDTKYFMLPVVFHVESRCGAVP